MDIVFTAQGLYYFHYLCGSFVLHDCVDNVKQRRAVSSVYNER